MLLRQTGEEWDVYPLRAAISILRSFYLIYHDKNGLISIHPLVHSWTRDQLNASEEDTVWRQTAATMALSIPWTFETVDYRFRQSAVPHIDACLAFREDGIFSLQSVGEDCQEMASNFALVYGEVGRLQESLQLTERVMEAHKRTLREERPDTLGSMGTLKDFQKSSSSAANLYRPPARSDKKSCIPHSSNRKTRLHRTFARLWEELV